MLCRALATCALATSAVISSSANPAACWQVWPMSTAVVDDDLLPLTMSHHGRCTLVLAGASHWCKTAETIPNLVRRPCIQAR